MLYLTQPCPAPQMIPGEGGRRGGGARGKKASQRMFRAHQNEVLNDAMLIGFMGEGVLDMSNPHQYRMIVSGTEGQNFNARKTTMFGFCEERKGRMQGLEERKLQ